MGALIACHYHPALVAAGRGLLSLAELVFEGLVHGAFRGVGLEVLVISDCVSMACRARAGMDGLTQVMS